MSIRSHAHRRGFAGACVIAAALCAFPSIAAAQQFSLFDRNIQVHGFASQGFVKSDNNNFLTMTSKQGSAEFSDGGINVASQITRTLRAGAQVYVRNIGDLTNGHVDLDWAMVDYRAKPWLGVRGGKVKTTLGLYNDNQDMAFLHTWAILPQSAYPLDLRASTIAHVGGDVYGTIAAGRGSSVAYTAFWGSRRDDKFGGYRYSLRDAGLPLVGSLEGKMGGTDVRWTSANGVTIGTSWLATRVTGRGLYNLYGGIPYDIKTKSDNTYTAYSDYAWRNLHINGELRREWQTTNFSFAGTTMEAPTSPTSAYASAAYRLSKFVEVGGYYSRFYADWAASHDAKDNHIYDKVFTTRFDVTSNFNVKVEAHFTDGYGDPYTPHGFYLSTNPSGFQPTTNMLVLRTGVNF